MVSGLVIAQQEPLPRPTYWVLTFVGVPGFWVCPEGGGDASATWVAFFTERERAERLMRLLNGTER